MITEGDPRPQVDSDVSVEELDGVSSNVPSVVIPAELTTQSILLQLATVALPLPGNRKRIGKINSVETARRDHNEGVQRAHSGPSRTVWPVWRLSSAASAKASASRPSAKPGLGWSPCSIAVIRWSSSAR
jgi:hypothetical protein